MSTKSMLSSEEIRKVISTEVLNITEQSLGMGLVTLVSEEKLEGWKAGMNDAYALLRNEIKRKTNSEAESTPLMEELDNDSKCQYHPVKCSVCNFHLFDSPFQTAIDLHNKEHPNCAGIVS